MGITDKKGNILGQREIKLFGIREDDIKESVEVLGQEYLGHGTNLMGD